MWANENLTPCQELFKPLFEKFKPKLFHILKANICILICAIVWKVSKYGVFSGPYFPTFALNTERYSLSLRIQSECGKIRTRKTPYLDTFLVSFKLNTLSDMKPVLFGRTYEIIMRSSYFKMIMYITTALRKMWENAVQLKYVVFLHIFRSAAVFIRIKCRTKMLLRCSFKIFIGNGLLTFRDV